MPPAPFFEASTFPMISGFAGISCVSSVGHPSSSVRMARKSEKAFVKLPVGFSLWNCLFFARARLIS